MLRIVIYNFNRTDSNLISLTTFNKYKNHTINTQNLFGSSIKSN